MIIDFQAHVFPEAYLAEMKRLDGAVILEEPDPHSGMSYFLRQEAQMPDQHGERFKARTSSAGSSTWTNWASISMCLTIPAPGADRFEGEDAIEIARIANDAIAAIARQHPKRFIGFFTLPTCDVKASLDELERSVNELGLHGFGCFANLNGQALDREELFPIYERLAKYKLPVYIHPTAPLATEAIGIDIMPTLDFRLGLRQHGGDDAAGLRPSARTISGNQLGRRRCRWRAGVSSRSARLTSILAGPRRFATSTGLKENPLDSFRRFYVDTADHPASTLALCERLLRSRPNGVGNELPVWSGRWLCAGEKQPQGHRWSRSECR